MYKVLVSISLSILLLGLPQAGLTLPESINFETKLTDAAPGEIVEIFQDNEGYIWLGSRSSVLRYNAYDFEEKYYSDSEDGSGELKVPSYTKEIFQDSEGVIWLGAGNGLFVFDQKKDLFFRPKPKEEPGHRIVHSSIRTINELPNGDLIAGGQDTGLVIIQKSPFRVKDVRTLSPKFQELPIASVFSILLDRKDRLWVTTEKGIVHLDLEKLEFTLYVPNPEKPDSVIDNTLTYIAEDRSGNIIGGTEGAGFYVFNPETEQFTNYVNDPSDPTSLARNIVSNVMVDSDGIAWLGHDQSGFSLFDSDTKELRNYSYEHGEIGGLYLNVSPRIFEDKNRDIWIGHLPRGLSFHDRSSRAIEVYRPNNAISGRISSDNVVAIMEDKKENLWVITGSGPNYFQRDKNFFKHYSQSLGNYHVSGALSGLLDSKGRVWVGSWSDGYHIYNKDKDTFELQPFDASLAKSPVKQSPVLNDGVVWDFCERKGGDIWMGTHYAGISRFDEKTKLFAKFKSEKNATSLPNDIAWSCHVDSKDRLWVGTGYGLARLNSDNETFTNYLHNANDPNGLQTGSVLSIYEDRDERIWLATEGGLHLYQEETDDFKVYNNKNGFHNVGIRAITQDLAGDLWVGTNDGITRFNPDTGDVKNFITIGGKKIGTINNGSALTSSRGEIIFGGMEGLIIIDTEALSINKNRPDVVFTDFKIFSKSQPVGSPDSIFSDSLNSTQTITLSYTQKMFSFDFAALNFRETEKNEYAYLMEGFDSEWREIKTDRKARYTNLNPGKYVFKVRGSNNDGVWSNQPKTIQIIQLPPPWKTWWAYTIYSFLVILIVFLVLYFQWRKRQKVEEQNRILEKRVAERTADLAEKNRNIQSMLSNMRQGLFTIEGTGKIHHEYSQFLEAIFDRSDIANQDAIEFIFGNANIKLDTLEQVKASLSSVIDMDIMNYEFNSHLLINELEINIDGALKIVSLGWDPIVEDDIVEKLMVSVRDITHLKALELEAAEKKRDLDIIGQLRDVSEKDYSQYHQVTASQLEECALTMESNLSSVDKVKSLFRTMHTIKGNSRARGFGHIAELAHHAESYYMSLNDVKQEHLRLDSGRIFEDLKKIELQLSEYDRLYNEVFNRSSSSESCGQGVWVEKTDIQLIQKQMESIKASNESVYTGVNYLLDKNLSSNLSEVLSTSFKSLEKIAIELSKEPPKVSVQEDGLKVRNDVASLFGDVFTHLLRNCIDHGIERPEQRRENGKPDQGHISIDVEAREDRVILTLVDDGQGLNVEKLYAIGLQKGRWDKDQVPTVSKIIHQVFEAGTSVKEQVTDISGRGVGMDAVVHTLNQLGGDINLVCDSGESPYEPDSTITYVPFEAKIDLPRELFVVAAFVGSDGES